MDAGQLVAAAAMAALVLFSAYLSAVETVVTRLGLVRALRLDEEEVRGADALLWLLEHRATALNVVLLLTVTARITLAAVATWLALEVLGGALSMVLAVVVLLLVSLLVGEIAPRTFVLRHLESAGLRLGRPTRGLVRVMRPVAAVLVAGGRAIVPVRTELSGPYAADEELREVLDDETGDDEIEDDERAMIHSIFELGDTVVREIMVPRPDMVTLAEDAPLRELVNTIISSGYSRIPVHRDSRDDIVGVVYAKDVLKRLAMQPGADRWVDLMRAPTFVPETKRVDDLLRSLQEQTVHLALVVDEYGGLVGLVTIEDILEEIVGEIVDEHDDEAPLVEVLDDDELRVDGRLPVDELNELLDADLPDEGWDTVGGLVVGTLGRVPLEGERIDIDGLRLHAERVQGRRVSKVLVHRREDDAPTDEAT